MSAAGFNISGDLKLNLRASTRQDKTCTMDRCPGDNTFGPTLGPRVGGCYDFDFTLVFEESIFSIAPCALVIPAAIFRLRTLLNFSLLSQKNEQELGQFIQWPLARALKLVRPSTTLTQKRQGLTTTAGRIRCLGVLSACLGIALGNRLWSQDTNHPGIGDSEPHIDAGVACPIRLRAPPVHQAISSAPRILVDDHPVGHCPGPYELVLEGK